MKLSIQKKILIFITVLIVTAVFILDLVNYRKTNLIMDKSLQDQSYKVIQTVDFTLNKFMTNMEGTINLIDNCGILNYNPTPEEGQNMIKYFTSITKSNSDISAAYFGTKDKKTFINSTTKLPDDYDPTSRGWYKKAAEAKSLVWTDPYLDAFTGKMAITVAKPVIVNNEVVGVYALDILLDTISNFLSSVKLGDTGYFTILDSNNMVIAHPAKDFIGKEIPIKEIKDEVSKNKKGTLIYTYNNIKNYAIYNTLSKTNWKIMGVIEYKESKANSNAMLINTIIYGAAILLVLIVVGGFITGRITKDIKILLKDIERMGQGDLSIRTNIKSNDEIGVLAKEFNKMIEDLSSLIYSAQNITKKVKEKSQSLENTNKKTVRSAEEISKTIEQIAHVTTEQAENSSIGAEKAAKLSEAVEIVTASVEKVVDLCNNTQSVNGYGTTVVKNLINITQESNESSANVKKAIDEIDSSSKEINTIIETINSIASQTNLLALNASIEAARAGEAGRGFAVVAEEIRKLAEQSTDSTSSIRELIVKVQNQTQNAVEEMNKSKMIVDKQTESVRITEKSFNEINNSINGLLNSIYQIEEMNKAVGNRKNEILDVIEGIAAGAEQTSASTEEISASTEEQLAVMIEVSNITKELMEISDKLDGEISKFKI
ncbi:methyl-accepting chemotaxis protein [Clostridium aciditolerans]|uniref:Methyl-accepting chemotaxis protein n=1 Tax=Clostridium aciditolerans TaxID=339861 RepID=A0A934I2Y5_9CLOT|nr:methyl-accepting chemotaxis protein [Clostridium aciditolerans]MBI6875132.1 methyl-accepting chemotaxis protein [Clostridium aciditolerans]